MVTTESADKRYLTVASNGRESIRLDAPVPKGGAGQGFGPHELLEAALASCLNMAVRMYASAHDWPLESVSSQVRLIRPAAGPICFEHSLELHGPLTGEQRATLMVEAERCPVRQTLLRPIEFRLRPAGELRDDGT
ncbi:MAG: OsmC family protein [Gammaproteobacteria bacterium]|nr:OsmC family protein [Gammaproteobacteria bacterium]